MEGRFILSARACVCVCVCVCEDGVLKQVLYQCLSFEIHIFV
jgi:hypothetical protein